MLIITEIAEAVQADRKDRHTDIDLFKALLEICADDDALWTYEFETHVKNSVEDELSDILIRCLDYVALRGICLDRVPSYVTSYCIDKSIAKRDFPTFAYLLTFKSVNGDVTGSRPCHRILQAEKHRHRLFRRAEDALQQT